MGQILSGQRKTLRGSWTDTGLTPFAAIFDNTTGSPALIATLAMAEYLPGMYQASFMPSAGVSYLVAMRVFSSPGVLDPNYSVLDDEFQCSQPLLDQSLTGHTNAGTVGGALSGTVAAASAQSALQGTVEPDTILIGEIVS